METSSPLAAIQPSMGVWGNPCRYRADPGSGLISDYAAMRPYAANSFRFRDLSMKKSQTDYFGMQPVRGSSPTASLAADLSQNCSIDQSPHLPTPRRALFTQQPDGAFLGHDTRKVTTPPIPSSSPGPAGDCMDISPLPHKTPFGCVPGMELQTPTPEPTPTEPSMPSSMGPPGSNFLQPSALAEKKKPGLRRPSLSRAKGLSTGSLFAKQPIENMPPPPFKSGNGASWHKPAASSVSSLADAFESSPAAERSSVLRHNPSMPPPRKPVFHGHPSASRVASPLGHVRKNSNSAVRPRKQFRRSLSMFESAEEVVNQDKAVPLSPIMDLEKPHVPQLPHSTPQDASNNLPRISKETLIEVLDGKYNQLYEKFVIIDCRFEYEFKGGHIDGAVNFNDKEYLSKQLFELEPTQKALLIFHCEYSAHRAPIMAKFIRNRDRAVNADQYPRLTYPETYILDGGYSSFFQDHRTRCSPQNYVEMAAQEHAHACERGLGKVKQRSKLLRAQTFAFGQNSLPMDDSPTANHRIRQDPSAMDIDLPFDRHSPLNPEHYPDAHISRDRRVLSY